MRMHIPPHSRTGLVITSKVFGVSLPSKRGFTLVEMVIVVAIVGVLTALSFAAFSRFGTTHVLDDATARVLSVLRNARTHTLAATNDSAHGVHFASTTVTRFAGTSYAPGAAANRVTQLPDSVSITGISLTGGGDTVVFKRLSGETDDTGTITLSYVKRRGSTATTTQTIMISTTGIAERQ